MGGFGGVIFGLWTAKGKTERHFSGVEGAAGRGALSLSSSVMSLSDVETKKRAAPPDVFQSRLRLERQTFIVLVHLVWFKPKVHEMPIDGFH